MEGKLKIALFESFYTGSHKAWADGLIKFSSHDIKLFSLKGRRWKWRMQAASMQLAQDFLEDDQEYDLVIITSLIDAADFIARCRKKLENTKTLLYFHENQITYPWSPHKKVRDHSYGIINLKSALACDFVSFNSNFHKENFLNSIPDFLKQFPDEHMPWMQEEISKKSSTIKLAVDLKRLDQYKIKVNNKAPLLLWNHRWEYDKNPQDLYHLLCLLRNKGFHFNLAITGESYKSYPNILDQIKTEFEQEIIHFGYAQSFEQYAKLLWNADISLSTANHDFFGISVVEAAYCGCYPILPKRLAYPEHFKNNENLYNSLEEAALKIMNYNKQSIDLSIVENYDWQESINHYDQTFKNFCDS